MATFSFTLPVVFCFVFYCQVQSVTACPVDHQPYYPPPYDCMDCSHHVGSPIEDCIDSTTGITSALAYAPQIITPTAYTTVLVNPGPTGANNCFCIKTITVSFEQVCMCNFRSYLSSSCTRCQTNHNQNQWVLHINEGDVLQIFIKKPDQIL
ncbi:uncharacterized protein [Amphiura filiformis]|uniref:uncharacterized protein n=1 Tax=Amphiura filiformis TaxID=82378 RepID=UPI003B20BDF3